MSTRPPRREGKRVQALGGAKNHLVVMPDANMEKSVEAIMSSAFGAAGERCLAGSVLVAVGDVADPLLDLLLAEDARNDGRRWLAAGDGHGPAGHRGSSQEGGGLYREGRRGGRDAAVRRTRAARRRMSGFFVGPTIFDNVRPEMTIAREEIFGPVLSVIRVKSLDDAIELVNSSRFGNTTSIFTQTASPRASTPQRIEVGMVGVNIGVAAPMAFFPFSGWKNSFFGDLHAHGKDAIAFYTEQKVIMTRWF